MAKVIASLQLTLAAAQILLERIEYEQRIFEWYLTVLDKATWSLK